MLRDVHVRLNKETARKTTSFSVKWRQGVTAVTLLGSLVQSPSCWQARRGNDWRLSQLKPVLWSRCGQNNMFGLFYADETVLFSHLHLKWNYRWRLTSDSAPFFCRASDTWWNTTFWNGEPIQWRSFSTSRRGSTRRPSATFWEKGAKTENFWFRAQQESSVAVVTGIWSREEPKHSRERRHLCNKLRHWTRFYFIFSYFELILDRTVKPKGFSVWIWSQFVLSKF